MSGTRKCTEMASGFVVVGDRSRGRWGVGADGDLVSFWAEENVLGSW